MTSTLTSTLIAWTYYGSWEDSQRWKGGMVGSRGPVTHTLFTLESKMEFFFQNLRRAWRDSLGPNISQFRIHCMDLLHHH